MPAGRRASNHNNEFRDRESNFEVSRRGIEFRDHESNFGVSRRDFANAKDQYIGVRNGYRETERGRIRDEGNGRVRQKDIKEREVVNVGYHSASGKSDSSSSSGRADIGLKYSGLPVPMIDREPGELSSESGSDDAIESGLQVKDSEPPMKVVESETWSPLEKKRKFSPIVWDREHKVATNSTKRSLTLPALPPQPPMAKVYRESPNIISNGGVPVSTIRSSENEDLQPYFPVKSPTSPGLDVYDASDSPVQMSDSPIRLSSMSPKHQGQNDPEAANLGDKNYVPTRNISSSRWASDDNSPVDEDEILDDEKMPKRRKKITPLGSPETRMQMKALCSKVRELKGQGFKGARVRSSESDEHSSRARSLSEDDYPGNDAEKDDYMDVDEEHDRNNTSISQSDTDTEDESDSRATPESTAPPQRSVNMLHGCRNVDEFERLNRIDEGTYGVVYRARDKKTGEIVALKKVKMEKEREGFPLTSLREINILLSFHHPSVVDVKEVVVGSSLDNIFMVMEYMEHDLKGLMETMKQPFSQSEVKCLMLQLLEGIKYLHDNWVLHRDLKTSNLLLNNEGELKICDFGLARQYGSPLKPYTHLVVTLWYRAPELLLGAKQYSTAIDMWSLGCVMAELLSKEPLFSGKTEVDQLDKIFRILGTPNETIWPGFSKLPGVKVNFVKHQYNLLRKKFPATSFTGSPVLSDSGFDLLNKLLTYDPEKRITAEAALNHEWFFEVPLPKSKEFMPTFPAQHAQDRRMRRIMKSPDPLKEQVRKELQQGEFGTTGLFG